MQIIIIIRIEFPLTDGCLPQRTSNVLHHRVEHKSGHGALDLQAAVLIAILCHASATLSEARGKQAARVDGSKLYSPCVTRPAVHQLSYSYKYHCSITYLSFYPKYHITLTETASGKKRKKTKNKNSANYLAPEQGQEL